MRVAVVVVAVLVASGCGPSAQRSAPPPPDRAAAPVPVRPASATDPSCPAGSTVVDLPSVVDDGDQLVIDACGEHVSADAVVAAAGCATADGTLDGPVAIVHADSRHTGQCVAGLAEGEWRAERGDTVQTSAYQRGKKHGAERIIDAAGIVTLEAHWRDDVLHGTMTERGPDGVVFRELDYRADEVVASRQWRAHLHLDCATGGDGSERCLVTDTGGKRRLEGTRAADAQTAAWTAWYPSGEPLATLRLTDVTRWTRQGRKTTEAGGEAGGCALLLGGAGRSALADRGLIGAGRHAWSRRSAAMHSRRTVPRATILS